MSDTLRLLFIGIMLVTLILILVGTGAMPVLWQIGTTFFNAVGGFLWGLIPHAR